MRFPTTYEEAKAEFPDAVKEAIEDLRKSRSKFRKADPATLKWFFTWGVQVQAHSFKDILNGKAQQRQKDIMDMTMQERIDDCVSRSICGVMVANSYHGKTNTVPKVILQHIVKSEMEEEAERRRLDEMPDEERAAEAERLLNELRGSPGFVEVHL